MTILYTLQTSQNQMKYQYTGPPQQSKLKTITIKLFVFISLLGVIYQGYQFIGSIYSGNTSTLRGPDKYCGNYTCYQLLNVQKSANQDEIKKSFRLLARKYHPDKSTQQNALEIFQALNKAYQTLSDQKSRFIYDLYLNNPQQSQYAMQFQYYNQKYIGNPQIPVPIVILGIVVCISLLQYVMRKQMQQKAVERIVMSHDFKIKVNERCGKNKKDKDQVRQQMINEIEIQGGLAKPTYKDIFGYKLILFPWTVILWLKDWMLWIVKYWILRKEYDLQAQVYLTKKSLQLSDRKWENLAQQQRATLLQKKLWIEENKLRFISQKRRQWLQQLRINNPGRYNITIKYMKQNNIKID